MSYARAAASAVSAQAASPAKKAACGGGSKTTKREPFSTPQETSDGVERAGSEELTAMVLALTLPIYDVLHYPLPPTEWTSVEKLRKQLMEKLDSFGPPDSAFNEDRQNQFALKHVKVPMELWGDPEGDYLSPKAFSPNVHPYDYVEGDLEKTVDQLISVGILVGTRDGFYKSYRFSFRT